MDGTANEVEIGNIASATSSWQRRIGNVSGNSIDGGLRVAAFRALFRLDELERGGVQAVAQARGRRAVLEDVAQVAVAAAAADLRARIMPWLMSRR
jgi:hypothetical protein